jgi:hypothetical protein
VQIESKNFDPILKHRFPDTGKRSYPTVNRKLGISEQSYYRRRSSQTGRLLQPASNAFKKIFFSAIS